MIPKIRVTLDKPTDGYWDGGKKQQGDFEVEGCMKDKPEVGNVVKWGCWHFNYWFNCGTGKSWKSAVMYAKRRLAGLINNDAKLDIIWED